MQMNLFTAVSVVTHIIYELGLVSEWPQFSEIICLRKLISSFVGLGVCFDFEDKDFFGNQIFITDNLIHLSRGVKQFI